MAPYLSTLLSYTIPTTRMMISLSFVRLRFTLLPFPFEQIATVYIYIYTLYPYISPASLPRQLDTLTAQEGYTTHTTLLYSSRIAAAW